MNCQKGLPLLLAVAALLIAVPAAALPVSIQVSGVAGAQAQEVQLGVDGMTSYNGNSAVGLYGASAGVGLPMGLNFSAHYFRHSNEYGRDLVANSANAFVSMDGNEWGLEAEWHLSLIPVSPLKPFIGLGAGYAHVKLDGKVEWEGESAALETDTDIYRIYAVGGLKLGSVVGVSVRAGMAFGEDEAAMASYTLAGQTVRVSADYQGYYVSGAVSLGF